MSTEIKSPTMLYDLCQQLFGIGAYDETDPDFPYYKARMIEVAKIKAMVTKRRLEYRTLGITAHYCADHGITIRSVGELIPHIGEALADMRQKTIAEKWKAIEDRRAELIALALEKGDHELADQLMRVELRIDDRGVSRGLLDFAADRLGVPK